MNYLLQGPWTIFPTQAPLSFPIATMGPRIKKSKVWEAIDRYRG
jgi:hypothetical protein